jgi:putative PIN family toxin of toxin-antitoxin system
VTRPVVVVDTNVVVSGLLTAEATAPTHRILNAMLDGRINFLLSIALLAEYREVMLRPRIQKRHGLSARDVDVILQAIAANAMIRDPEVLGQESPDPADAHLWALAKVHPGAVLITGDQALLDHPAKGVIAITPSAFAEQLAL